MNGAHPFSHLSENDLVAAIDANGKLRGLVNNAVTLRLDWGSRAVVIRARADLKAIAEDLDAEVARRRRAEAERERLETFARACP